VLAFCEIAVEETFDRASPGVRSIALLSRAVVLGRSFIGLVMPTRTKIDRASNDDNERNYHRISE